MAWYIIITIVVLVLVMIPLRSWYVGCGLGLLGAILAGGAAFGAGWYYVKYHYVRPRPRHDMDFGGMETPLICLVFLPLVCAIVGLLLGIVCAYWLDLWSSDEPPSKREPLDL
jgi:hypothetical protein